MAAANSPFTVLLLGRTGMGKSVTGNQLINAVTGVNPLGNRRVKRIWPKEEVGRLRFYSNPHRTCAGQRVTEQCELLFSSLGEAGEVQVLDSQGFAGSDFTGDVHLLNLRGMREIANVTRELQLRFDRILYFLPVRGGIEQADAALQEEIGVMWRFFGEGIFRNMVLVTTLQEGIPSEYAPEEESVRRDFSVQMRLALESNGVSKIPPCPPVLFIPLKTDPSALLRSVKGVPIQGSRALKLTFHSEDCFKCASVLYYRSGTALIEVESGKSFHGPNYNDSMCHPVFIPKYTKLQEFAGCFAHIATCGFARVHELRTGQQMLPKLTVSEEVCANCGQAPGSTGCMRVMKDHYEGQYVRHDNAIYGYNDAEQDLVPKECPKVTEQYSCHQDATSTDSPQNQTLSVKESILSQNVYEYQGHLMLIRSHVSRKAAGKGRAVLEGVGHETAVIKSCFKDNPLDEEEAVQTGIIKWIEGTGRQPPTWEILLNAMDFAKIGQQHIQSLQTDLGLM